MRLIEALSVDFLGIPPLDVYKLSTFAHRERKKIYEVFSSAALLEKAGIATRAACLALFKKLSAWRTAAENRGAADVFEAVVRESGFLASLLDLRERPKSSPELHVLFDVLKAAIEQKEIIRSKIFLPISISWKNTISP